MTARNITIQNLSSGDILHFRSVSITKYSSRYNINYDSTQVIGRMDPIRNFKNTERIINASFFVKTKSLYHYKRDTPIDPAPSKELFLEIHKETKQLDDKEKLQEKGIRKYEPSHIYDEYNRFFYPSYEREAEGAGQYFMKSAPIFRVSVGDFAGDNQGNAGFFYCTIPTFDVVSLSDRASIIRGLPPGVVDAKAKGGSATVKFNSYDFDLTMHVINVKEENVSSILINRGNTQITQKKVLNPQN